MYLDNRPRWPSSLYEVWYLKLNSEPGSALWLRFTLLNQKTGLKKVAETWAIHFDSSGTNTQKVAIKNTSSLGAFSSSADGKIQIEDSVFFDGIDAEGKRVGYTRGNVVSRNQKIEWDFSFTPNDHTFFHVPTALTKFKIAKSAVCKPNVDVKFSGWYTVGDKRYEAKGAPGCQGHIWGTRYAHSWAWAHCNAFQKQGVTIEALSARVKLAGLVASPLMSAFYLDYKGERYEWNSLWDAFTIKSEYGLSSWAMSGEKRDLKFKLELSCETRDLVGVTYDDTVGDQLFCNNTAFATTALSIYKNDKLEETLQADRVAAFETVSYQRSPYVEVLV